MISAWPVIIFLLLWVASLKAQNSKLERNARLNGGSEMLALPPAPTPIHDDPKRPGHYTEDPNQLALKPTQELERDLQRLAARLRGGKEY